MTAFKRLSTVPTVPDLLRRDAERRAARLRRLTPIEAWCRPAMIAVVWQYRDNGRQRESGPLDGFRRQAEFFHPPEELARTRTVSREMSPSVRPTRARSRAIARSRRMAMRADPAADGLHAWSRRAGVKVCFASANGVLAAARVANWCGLLSPDGLGAAIACSDRLTRAGMRLWRSGRTLRRT